MSILIKDMGMPKSCVWMDELHNTYSCPLLDSEDCCRLQECREEWTWEEQYDGCPLEELTECEDAVSRKAARHALCKAVHKNDSKIPCENQTASCLWSKTRVCDYVRESDKLPPVTPKPKTGHWIITSKFDDCYYARCD